MRCWIYTINTDSAMNTSLLDTPDSRISLMEGWVVWSITSMFIKWYPTEAQAQAYSRGFRHLRVSPPDRLPIPKLAHAQKSCEAYYKQIEHRMATLATQQKADLYIVTGLLPAHYVCKPVPDGVFCLSEKGISESDSDQAFCILLNALKMIFRERFLEVFHQTCTNHSAFTVYLKPS